MTTRYVYIKTALNGGGAGSLDLMDGLTGGKDGEPLLEGDIAYVYVGNLKYEYWLDDDLNEAENSPNWIVPDTNPGTKVWVLQNVYSASSRSSTKVVGAADYNPSVLTTDYKIAVDNTAVARAVTISNEDIATGSTSISRDFIIKDQSMVCHLNNITISLESGGTIDGAATFVMNQSGQSILLYIDGTNAWIY